MQNAAADAMKSVMDLAQAQLVGAGGTGRKQDGRGGTGGMKYEGGVSVFYARVVNVFERAT